MPKDIVDRKARDTIPGSGLGRVVNEQSWGADKAIERYGSAGVKVHQPPPDRSAPQFRQDQRGPDWADDTANDWRRGNLATDKPNFMPGYKGKK